MPVRGRVKVPTFAGERIDSDNVVPHGVSVKAMALCWGRGRVGVRVRVRVGVRVRARVGVRVKIRLKRVPPAALLCKRCSTLNPDANPNP